MQLTDQFQQEHGELLALADAVTLHEPVTPAAAERARRQLAVLGKRLADHLSGESATIRTICGSGVGALATACSIRQREAEGLEESIAGLVRRWGRAGAIERDPRGFISTWEVLVAAIQRLQSREEGEIYPVSGSWQTDPIAAPPSTGLPAIDCDHEKMFAMIGGLRAAVGGGMRFIDARLAADLASYIEDHMANEEAIMAATAFPGLEDHRAEHLLARTILHGFHTDYLDGRHVEAASVLEFLERWLNSHIALVDQAMARHALASGRRAVSV